MKELFLNFKHSQKLKELGFDEPTFTYYNENAELKSFPPYRDKLIYPQNSCLLEGWVGAPLYTQAISFLLKKLEKIYGEDNIIIDITLPDNSGEIMCGVNFQKKFTNINKLFEIIFDILNEKSKKG